MNSLLDVPLAIRNTENHTYYLVSTFLYEIDKYLSVNSTGP